MGISGLLKMLQEDEKDCIMKTQPLSIYSGKTVAIDGYGWLHRAIHSAAQQLALGTPGGLSKLSSSFMNQVNRLSSYGIIPYVVFDGDSLVQKSDVEKSRLEAREKNRALGLKALKAHNTDDAQKFFSRAVDVTTEMTHYVIQELKKRRVSYVVAPYEADAQMTYLAINNHVDAVLTEDSDMITFGCPLILYKWGKSPDSILEYSKERLQQSKAFGTFTSDMILNMCILSGCDYVKSIPTIGLVKAYKLIRQAGEKGGYTRVIRRLQFEGKLRIPADYAEEFNKARLTFKHQRVYDPTSRTCVHLTELEEESEKAYDFLGPVIPNDIVSKIAEGEVDPHTRQRFKPIATKNPFAKKAAVNNNTIKHKKAVALSADEENIVGQKPTAFSRLMKGSLNRHEKTVKRKMCLAQIKAKRQFAEKKSLNTVGVDAGNKTSRFFR